ncbi:MULTISPECIES: tape measure protein [unclassified Microbacterium]|uniref:tape measure protein n=1 Tax=unclassified Microbacterium TaxID=2609290 RepID=UPI00109C6642|nr:MULTISPECIES: tape measure protein [unclassified Microbacterium]
MAEAALFVEIVPTTSGVKRAIEKDLNGAFQETEKKGSGVLNKLGGLAKGVGFAAAGAVAAFTGISVAGGFSRAMKIDEAQAKLRGLGNDTKAVETIMGNALAAVQGTSFGLDAAATTAAGAVAAGIAPGAELERVLTSVANAAAAAGVDLSDMGSIYNKVASLGKAQNDVLQQVADRGIPIYQALADQMGVTADEVFKLASAGEIGFAQFESAMSSASGTVAAEMGTTLPGLIDNMMASVSRIGEGLITGIFPQLKDGVAGVTSVFKEWEIGAKDIGAAIGTFVADYGPMLVDTLVGIFNAGSAVVGWVQDNVTWLGPLAAAVVGAALAFGAWQAAIGLWSAATKAAVAIQAAFNVVMNANPIMLIVTAIGALVAGLVWFFTQTELGQEIWANFTQFLGEAWANISGFFTAAWENVIQPIFQAIGEVFTWVYENIIMPVVTGIMMYIGLWAALITWLWETVLSPVFAAIGEVFTWIYENVIVPIIDGIILYFQAWGAIFTWLWETIIQPVFAALGEAFTWIYENIIAPVGAAIGAAIQFIGDTIHNVFTGIADFIGAAFQAVLDVVRGPINGLIGLINSVIDGLNSISIDIPDWVPMVGGQTFGLSIPHIPQLEDGALVKARTGGIIANIGEGRYDEMVVPLSPQVLGQLNGGGKGGGTVNVYPQPGMSEETIGRIAGDRLDYLMRRA